MDLTNVHGSFIFDSPLTGNTHPLGNSSTLRQEAEHRERLLPWEGNRADKFPAGKEQGMEDGE